MTIYEIIEDKDNVVGLEIFALAQNTKDNTLALLLRDKNGKEYAISSKTQLQISSEVKEPINNK